MIHVTIFKGDQVAAIVYQTDKRSGITYAYESISFWDKDKKQSRSKRTLIGRVDNDTQQIVPTDGRCRKDKQEKVLLKTGLVVAEISSRTFYGATYLFDRIGEKLGITNDLKNSFPDSYKKYYLLYIILYLKKILLHLDLRSGVLYINIHMQRVYLRKEVVNYLLQLKMMQKIDFLLFKLNVK